MDTPLTDAASERPLRIIIREDRRSRVCEHSSGAAILNMDTTPVLLIKSVSRNR